ncbi:hypothetical protein [Ancylobacter sp. IITR112]|uniref:DUF6894 family protein n=1 Tax=Ancylobacter sp. IITR112 TaxID=3138073 RepID=UPI00352B73A2
MPTFAFQWTGETAPALVDLPDEAAAWRQAVATTGEILRDLDGSLPVPGDFEMTVRDATGAVLLAITIHTRQRPVEGEG